MTRAVVGLRGGASRSEASIAASQGMRTSRGPGGLDQEPIATGRTNPGTRSEGPGRQPRLKPEAGLPREQIPRTMGAWPHERRTPGLLPGTVLPEAGRVEVVRLACRAGTSGAEEPPARSETQLVVAPHPVPIAYAEQLGRVGFTRPRRRAAWPRTRTSGVATTRATSTVGRWQGRPAPQREHRREAWRCRRTPEGAEPRVPIPASYPQQGRDLGIPPAWRSEAVVGVAGGRVGLSWLAPKPVACCQALRSICAGAGVLHDAPWGGRQCRGSPPTCSRDQGTLVPRETPTGSQCPGADSMRPPGRPRPRREGHDVTTLPLVTGAGPMRTRSAPPRAIRARGA